MSRSYDNVWNLQIEDSIAYFKAKKGMWGKTLMLTKDGERE